MDQRMQFEVFVDNASRIKKHRIGNVQRNNTRTHTIWHRSKSLV